MHENRNVFLFLIESIICTTPDTFYQHPGPVFGAAAAGAVFRDIETYAYESMPAFY